MDGLKILDMPPISPYLLEQVEKALPFAISKGELEHYSDGTGKRYNTYFREWALEINDKLTAAGIKTIIGD